MCCAIGTEDCSMRAECSFGMVTQIAPTAIQVHVTEEDARFYRHSVRPTLPRNPDLQIRQRQQSTRDVQSQSQALKEVDGVKAFSGDQWNASITHQILARGAETRPLRNATPIDQTSAFQDLSSLPASPVVIWKLRVSDSLNS